MTMNAYQRIDDADAPAELLSIAEAARVLHISQSTLWRWIGRGEVPAYRIGPKRVWLKKADLDFVSAPVQQRNGHGGKAKENVQIGERLLTPAERELFQSWRRKHERGYDNETPPTHPTRLPPVRMGSPSARAS